MPGVELEGNDVSTALAARDLTVVSCWKSWESGSAMWQEPRAPASPLTAATQVQF
jgi:hypothetical protein